MTLIAAVFVLWFALSICAGMFFGAMCRGAGK